MTRERSTNLFFFSVHVVGNAKRASVADTLSAAPDICMDSLAQTVPALGGPDRFFNSPYFSVSPRLVCIWCSLPTNHKVTDVKEYLE